MGGNSNKLLGVLGLEFPISIALARPWKETSIKSLVQKEGWFGAVLRC